MKPRDPALLKITIFLITSFAVAYAIDFSLILLTDSGLFASAYQLTLMVRMFAPLLGVIISLLITDESVIKGLRNYGLRIGKEFLKWFFAALTIPLVILVLGALYALLLGLPVKNPAEALIEQMYLQGGINPMILLTFIILFSLVAGATINAILAFGEEIGWRGLLLDELSRKMSRTEAILMIGVIWAAWHFPLIILFGYNYPENRLLGLLLYMVICIIWSWILAILRTKSLSIIHPSVMHGTINSLGGLMLITVPVDRVIGIPVGLLSIMASATILAILSLAVKLSEGG